MTTTIMTLWYVEAPYHLVYSFKLEFSTGELPSFSDTRFGDLSVRVAPTST